MTELMLQILPSVNIEPAINPAMITENLIFHQNYSTIPYVEILQQHILLNE